MMSGVAQVMGMKPTLRSFFSSLPFSCAMASRAPRGKTLAMAAIAVFAPTARRKRRRSASFGKSAFITAVCRAWPREGFGVARGGRVLGGGRVAAAGAGEAGIGVVGVLEQAHGAPRELGCEGISINRASESSGRSRAGRAAVTLMRRTDTVPAAPRVDQSGARRRRRQAGRSPGRSQKSWAPDSASSSREP